MELKEEIDELRAIVDEGTERKSPALMSEGAADIDNALSIKASLAQNAPNPFTDRTTIRFTLPDDVRNAYIYIFDMQGKMQKQIPVDAFMQSIPINGYELSAGMYICSLVVNGKEIDTKRMILSK